MGFETPEEGYLAKIVIPGGTKDVPVGKVGDLKILQVKRFDFVTYCVYTF